MYRFDYGDEAVMHQLAQRLNKAGETLTAEGIHLLYHNHNCELRHVNAEKRAYDILLEETDLPLSTLSLTATGSPRAVKCAGMDAAAWSPA